MDTEIIFKRSSGDFDSTILDRSFARDVLYNRCFPEMIEGREACQLFAETMISHYDNLLCYQRPVCYMSEVRPFLKNIIEGGFVYLEIYIC